MKATTGLTAGLLAGLCLLMPVAESNEPRDAQLTLSVAAAHSVLKADTKQSAWVRVGVTGSELKRTGERPPVNLAIVLDRSGSMQGEKITRAREAAADALSLLDSRDIVSIVAYDSGVEVLVPATKLTDRESVVAAIRRIQANGNTALFAGVSKGAAEVRKFAQKEYVNRIILLSDGLANVGPSSPAELGSLGTSLKKENISVSTLGLGLGYNEDLMVQLAGHSGGNHQFIENASELVDIFRREFDDVLSVVAQEVDLTITIPEGIRPVRVLGNEADIDGQQVVTRLSQIYSRQTRYVVLELELPASAADTQIDVASVDLSSLNMSSGTKEHQQASAHVCFSNSDAEVAGSLNKAVMADVVALIASEKNKLATQLLDQGDLLGCRRVLMENSLYLQSNGTLLNSDSLTDLSISNGLQLKALEGAASPQAPGAVTARKNMRALQINVDQQQDNRAAPSANAPK